ncbi:MAG: tol-pal system protein YbgF [Reichenbachiella sp.]
MFRFLFIILLISPTLAFSQANDSIPLLLLDTEIQIEATEGINSMYNFDFKRADSQFKWLKGKYGWHPLPYFLLGLSQWWRIMPDIKNTSYDEQFLMYMDSSILLAENIFTKGSQVEGGFFLAAAHAFKGRLYAERRSWTKAASEGKKALNYLEYTREKEEFGPEILFGDAIYNYYSVWVPEHYPILKPVMVFFKDGNKELGMNQLMNVANNAFFTRTEAQYYLMQIHSSEGDRNEAMFRADYLHKTFPNNAYFHRYYARMLYSMGRYTELKASCHSILNKIDSLYQGYELNSGRYAAFFLGQVYSYDSNEEQAKKFYKKTVAFGEKIGAQEKGYHLFSLLKLGEMALKEDDETTAKSYFKQVKKLASRKSKSYKMAKGYLKEL